MTNTMQPENNFMTAGAREKEFMEHIEKSKDTRLTLFEALAQHPNEFHKEIQDEADIERVRAAAENADAEIKWLRSQAKLLDQARSGASIALEMATGEQLTNADGGPDQVTEFIDTIASVKGLFDLVRWYGDTAGVAGELKPDTLFGVGRAGYEAADKASGIFQELVEH